MASTAKEPFSEPISLPKTEAKQIQQLRKILEAGAACVEGSAGERVPVPADVHALLLRLVRLLQQGQAVSILPYARELTTRQAADLMGFSRQFLVRLLEQGKIPFHRAGTHRRVLLSDVLAFKENRDRARHAALKDLARRDVASGVYDTVILPDE